MKKFMFKFTALCLSMLMLAACFMPAASALAIRVGDVNSDGKIKANDARLVLRFAAGLEDPDARQRLAADVTLDSFIKANDARRILRAAAGLEELNATIIFPGDDPEPPEEAEVDFSSVQELFGVEYADGDTETDSDADGLTDYEEIYITGTNPLELDSDFDGEDDAFEDPDEDGISNIYELHDYGTSPTNADTDGDGLTDGDEALIYETDPLEADTDGDTLSDGFEIEKGLDPLSVISDGITPDSERLFEQSVDSLFVDSALLSEDNEAPVTVGGTLAGDINELVSLSEADTVALEDMRAIVGKQVLINEDCAEENQLCVSFDCSRAGVNSASLLVCRYEDGKIVPCETSRDNDTISAVADSGIYFAVDSEKYLRDMGVDVEKYIAAAADSNDEDEGIFSQASFAFNKNTLSAGSVAGQADIVFAVDSTGSMSGAINNVAENIGNFVDALYNKYSVRVNFALVDYKDITIGEQTKLVSNGSSNWFSDAASFKSAVNDIDVDGGGDNDETPLDALGMASRLDFRKGSDKFVVLVTDAGYKTDNNYGIESLSSAAKMFANAGITVSVISYDYLEDDYSPLFTETNGVFGEIDGLFSSVLLSLADKIGETVNDGSWVMLSDGQFVKLLKPLSPDSGDSDADGISDYDELGDIEKMDLTEFLKAFLDTYGIPYEQYEDAAYVEAYAYTSDPTRADTDYDGIDDADDENPTDNFFTGTLNYSRYKEKKSSRVYFNVDYRDFFKSNTVYSDSLAMLSSLRAADIYNDLYVEVTGGAKGGSDSATEFPELFGLEDVEDIKLSAEDYDEDKDDVSEITVGHRSVTYRGETKQIIVVTVRGTNGTNAEWSSNFDVGADTDNYYSMTGYSHPDWTNKENHKGFDVAATRISRELTAYFERHGIDSADNKSIIFSGHSRGAAIANLLGQYYTELGGFTVFTYTFAAPNCTTSWNAGEYKNIFNILNEDDIIPCLPLEDWGFTKYGVSKSISIEKNYESTFKIRPGTWEYLVGVDDYNNDGGTQRTLDAFNEIVSCREDLYVLDDSSDGSVWENNLGHTTYDGAEKEYDTLMQALEKEKMLKFAKLSIVYGFGIYHVEIQYCPAYFMQTLSNMTTGVGATLGRDVKGKYARAKASFVATSGETPGHFIGGMADPHLPITYYFIAQRKFIK